MGEKLFFFSLSIGQRGNISPLLWNKKFSKFTSAIRLKDGVFQTEAILSTRRLKSLSSFSSS